MLFVISGKQVKILYEPVAVRCEKNSRFCPIAAGRGQAIGSFPEKARRFSTESKYPGDKASQNKPRKPASRGNNFKEIESNEKNTIF